MSSEASNKRKEKEATENRRRTINYIVVAVLAALIVTVLFLVFGRSDNNYVAQCTATAKNGFGVKKDVICRVWFEQRGDLFVITAVQIDGVRLQ